MSDQDNKKIVWDKELDKNNISNDKKPAQNAQGQSNIPIPPSENTAGGHSPTTPPIVSGENSNVLLKTDSPMEQGQAPYPHLKKEQTVPQPGSQVNPQTSAEKNVSENTPAGMGSEGQKTADNETYKPDFKTGNKHYAEQTYYDDVAKITHSKEGGVVAGMLARAREEEKIKKIKSPKTLKNQIFIIFSSILIILAIAVLSWIFLKPETNRIIEDILVESLIPADRHFGLDITKLSPLKTKELIAKVLKKRPSSGSIDHIYYVERIDSETIKRLGSHDVLAAIGKDVPKAISQNINKDFMHGVYTTDTEHPFMIFTTDSYDRSFNAMREWEADMTNDLFAFMDFPNEVNNRKLNDIFQDEVIENKPARVLRYTPQDPQETESDESGLSWLQNINNYFASLNLAGSFYTKNVFAEVECTLKQGAPESLPVYTLESDITGDNKQHYLCADVELKEFDLFGDRLCIPVEGAPFYLNLTYKKDIPDGAESFYDCDLPELETVENPDYYKTLVEKGAKYTCFLKDGYTGPSPIDKENILPPGDLYKYLCIPTLDVSTNFSLPLIKDFTLSLTENKKIPLSCFNEDTGKRNMSKFVDTPGYICLNPIICIVENLPVPADNNTHTIKEGCFVSLSIASLEKIDVYSCMTGFIDSDLTRENGQCFKPIATTSRQFYYWYDINNIREALRNAAGYLSIGAQIMNLPWLREIPGIIDRGSGRTLSEDMRYLADELWKFSSRDILINKDGSTNTIGKIAKIAQNIEVILNRLESYDERLGYGFSDNWVTRNLRRAIDILKNLIGLGNSLTWITLNGYLETEGYLDVDNYIYAGGDGTDVVVVQAALINLALLDGVVFESNRGILDITTQKAIRIFQKLNNLLVTGILDRTTITVINQMIEAGISIVGTSYNTENFEAWNVLAFLQTGGILVTPNGEILTGGSTSEVTEDFSEMTLEEFIEAGGALNVAEENLSTDGGTATIGSTLWRNLEQGVFGQDVQVAQIVLRSEGINVESLNGIYDLQFANSVRTFQSRNGLNTNGAIDVATRDSINSIINDMGLIGSGYTLQTNGFLEGTGQIKTNEQSGVSILPGEAFGRPLLNPGDIIIMYMFLDENTILITQNDTTAKEIIRRRANAQLISE